MKNKAFPNITNNKYFHSFIALIIFILTIPIVCSSEYQKKHYYEICSLDKKYLKNCNLSKPGDEDRKSLTLLPSLENAEIGNFSVIATVKREHLLQQKDSNIEKLLSNAKSTNIRLKKFLLFICSKIPNSRIIVSPLKPKKTIDSLLLTRWEGDASRITDYVRATISFETWEDLQAGLSLIINSGLIILNISDHFQFPSEVGYRDVNIVFRDYVNGHLGEIQLNLHNLVDYKNAKGHQRFEIIRDLQAKIIVQNKKLTSEENLILQKQIAESKTEYDEAFKKSFKNLKEIRLGVYLLVKDNNDQILMTKTRSKNRLIWNLPGGGVVAGESIQTALRRELKEELNVDCWDFSKVKNIFTNYDFHINPDYPNSQMVNIYFYLPVKSEDFQLLNKGDVEEIKWFPINQLPLKDMLSADVEFVQFLRKNLNGI